MGRSKVAASHVEWLSLVETTGVFLTVPVVRRVFPDGIGAAADELRSEVRLRLQSGSPTQAWATTWTRWVLRDLLGLQPALLESQAVPERATHLVPEHGVMLRPEYVVTDVDGDAASRALRMLVLSFPLGTARDRPVPGDRWAATPIDRAFALQRATGVPLVMATDGDWFTVVANPASGTATSATWISSIFGEEPILLDSFVALLGARRFFAVDTPNTLPAMLAEAAQAQEEVTSRLGTQVRQAVELLVGALSRANRARRGELLADVSAETVYAAALTVMMRTVFLLYAEERDLLPAREALYADSYGVLGLRDQLQDEADRFGEEALERRSAGWHRLLAAFRAIHGGIEHEALRLPAYGGGLFDPDRYPFLEGRRADEPWRTHESRPLPVDDRSVLAILDALQVLTFRDGGVAEARRLSYRSLDVEQIGHVYEGLLDHGAVKVDDLAVGLKGSTSDGPELAVELLEEAAAKGHDALVKFLVEETGRTTGQIEKGLAVQPASDLVGRLRSACEHDDDLVRRVLPYVGLLEEDLRGLPMVFMPGSVYVTATTERRDTGTQYTPKDLADEIVRYALEPLVYEPGPAQGADPADWQVRPPEAILGLRVCDPAVGSGAILVAACRYLSERLIEAARAHLLTRGDASVLDADDPDVALVARRLVVDHCLYGVDRNPLAAEMAKLSLWLVTLAKERPFTFLDHAIRVGDSLLGITNLDQVRQLHLDPERGRLLHGNLLAVTDAIQPLVDSALEWIQAMRGVEPISVSDVEEQRAMNAEAERALENVRTIADAIVGKALAATRPGSTQFDERLAELSVEIRKALDSRRSEAERLAIWNTIQDEARYDLDTDRPAMAPPPRPFHWPLAFPEVFLGNEQPGFDAMVGNPPFLGGKRISIPNGSAYRENLVNHVAHGRAGNADLVAYFLLRASALTKRSIGFFATNTVSEGGTRQVGLDQLHASSWSTARARRSREWPGSASVRIAQIWAWNGPWSGTLMLDDHPVASITTSLTAGTRVSGIPHMLGANRGIAFIGVFPYGTGFTIDPATAAEIIEMEPQSSAVLRPFLTGEDLVSNPTQSASQWIIDFDDMTEGEARRYPVCWAKLEVDVRPERSRRDAKKYPQLVQEWWKFWRPRPALRAAVSSLDFVLATTIHNKVVLPVRIRNDSLWSHGTVVFAYADWFHFGVLTSAVHWAWALRYSSSLGDTVRYTPSDVFETFPQPAFSPQVETAARALDEYRARLMLTHGHGLTSTYNRVHSPSDAAPDIVRLRDLHVDLDETVRQAYGWSDLHFDHGFWETRMGIRYSLEPATQAEILDRLLELNHARHAREQADQATGARPVRKQRRSSPGQTSMLGED
jgi:hypothetical protein